MATLLFCSNCIPVRNSTTREHQNLCRGRWAPTSAARKWVQIRATAPSSSAPSSFGRGVRFPKRLVGLYELERLGVDTKNFIAPNSREELGFSVAIAVTVIFTIFVPLVSPNVNLETPAALLIAAAMVFWAVDTLGLDGIISRAVSAMIQDRRRVAMHEAGHFLVSYLLGIGVTGYELLSAKRILTSLTGPELTPGVQIDTGERKLDAYLLSAVGMAGIAAEVVHYGKSEGGAEDMAEVSRHAKELSPGTMTEADLKRVCRWGLMQGVTLIQAHRDALLALTDAMLDGRSVEECTALIDASVTESNLKPLVKSVRM